MIPCEIVHGNVVREEANAARAEGAVQAEGLVLDEAKDGGPHGPAQASLPLQAGG